MCISGVVLPKLETIFNNVKWDNLRMGSRHAFGDLHFENVIYDKPNESYIP